VADSWLKNGDQARRGVAYARTYLQNTMNLALAEPLQHPPGRTRTAWMQVTHVQLAAKLVIFQHGLSSVGDPRFDGYQLRVFSAADHLSSRKLEYQIARAQRGCAVSDDNDCPVGPQ
jgi:hypothetical protein